MSPSATIMTAALLLAGPDGGEVRRLRGIRVAKEPPVLELERIKVNRAPVNEDHNSELALSARHAGTVALHLLFRELNYNDPVTRLWFDIEPPSMAVTGRSGELFFGLTAYLHLGRDDLPAGIPNASFMATGTLDRDGNVGSVDQVAVKVRAALAAGEPSGAKLFYPRADEGQIDDALRLQCRDHGLLLCAVDRIDEALAMLGVPIIGSWPSGVSPFRSLQAFDTSFSRVFFGRQREVAALASLLDARAAAGKPGALIIGASGAGKSSFCLAGLIPALTKSRPGLDYAVWRPRDAVSGLGDDAADEGHVARSIAAQWQVRDANQPGLALSGATSGIDRLDQLPDCLAPATSDGRIFIVDQFEELFTLAFAPEARIAFARFLQSLQAKGIWVIGTLRSEFYPQYLELADADGAPVLTPMFEGDGQYNLPRMSREALAQVIVRPAELAGLRFEQRNDEVTLAQALLADAMATDDALPLLGFALQTLYDEAERPAPGADRDAAAARTLTFAAYDRLGGLSGAIGVVAARAYGALDAAAQAELPALLSALAVPSPDGSRETARPAPIAAWPVGSAGRRLIDALTDIRVLVSERVAGVAGPAQVRVAHEALFSHWDVAAQVLNDSRQNRLLIEDFRQRAVVWDADGRPRGALLSSQRDVANGRAVRSLLSVSSDNAPLIAFVETSINRSRRQRQFLYSSAAAIALMLTGTTGWALVSEKQAQVATAQALSEKRRSERSAEGERDARILAQANLDKSEANERKALASAEAARLAGLSAQLAAAAERQQSVEATRQRDLALAATRRAEMQTLEARRQRSRAVAQLAEQAIDRGDAMTGILLARTQLQPEDDNNWTSAAQSALLRGVMANRERAVLEGHRDSVNHAEFSPDSQRIVTASDDGTARIWTVNGGRVQSIALDGSSEEVTFSAFSPDNQRVVTGSSDGTVRLWTINGDRVLSTRLVGHTSPISHATFSPDGTQLVTTALYDEIARLWKIDGEQIQSTPMVGHSNGVNYAEFSPDGQRIVTASDDSSARVWTVDGDRLTSIPLLGHSLEVTHATFSPDGRHILTSSWDRTARIWTVDSLQTNSISLIGHTDWVSHAEFSRDGSHIVTSSSDNTARIWKINGDEISFVRLMGHSAGLSYASFSPDGQFIVTSSWDGTASLWPVEGEQVQPIILAGHSRAVLHADFSPDGSKIVTSSQDGSARIWDAHGTRLRHNPLSGYEENIAYAAFSSNSQSIFVQPFGNVDAHVWILGGEQPIALPVESYDAYIKYAAFSNDSSHIIKSPISGNARLLSVRHNEVVSQELSSGSVDITYAEFSNNNRWAVSVHADGTARLWDLLADEIDPILIDAHRGAINHAKFSLQGDMIITSSDDGNAQILELRSGNFNSINLLGHNSRVIGAAFSPDGMKAVTTSEDGAVRLWSIDRDPVDYISLLGHTGSVTSAKFSPDGNFIVTTSEDQSARVWNISEQELTSIPLIGHSSAVTYAEFSSDSKRVVTIAHLDGVARLWFIDGGQAHSVEVIVDDDDTAIIHQVQFTNDGNSIVATGFDQLWRWHVPSEHGLLRLSDRKISRCLSNRQIDLFHLNNVNGVERDSACSDATDNANNTQR